MSSGIILCVALSDLWEHTAVCILPVLFIFNPCSLIQKTSNYFFILKFILDLGKQENKLLATRTISEAPEKLKKIVLVEHFIIVFDTIKIGSSYSSFFQVLSKIFYHEKSKCLYSTCHYSITLPKCSNSVSKFDTC